MPYGRYAKVSSHLLQTVGDGYPASIYILDDQFLPEGRYLVIVLPTYRGQGTGYVVIEDSSGQPVGGAGSPDREPEDLAATGDGGFLIASVFRQALSGFSAPGDIVLERYDPSGTLVWGPVRVNASPDYSTADPPSQPQPDSPVAEFAPSAAELADGSIAVAWTSRQGGSDDIYVALVSASGTVIRAEQLAHADTYGVQWFPVVTALQGGGFLVTWEGQDGTGGMDSGIEARLFDADGAPVSDAFIVNTTTAGNQGGVSVAQLASGNLIAVWGSEGVVRGQMFAANGDRIGSEFAVTALSSTYARAASVEAHPDGGFVVAWKDSASADDMNGNGISALAFNGAGLPEDLAYRLVEGPVLNFDFDLRGTELRLTYSEATPAFTAKSAYSVIFQSAGPIDQQGTADPDVLAGDARDNALSGLAGDDLLSGGLGADRLDGGDGIDTAIYADDGAAVFVNLSLGQGFGNSAQGDTYTSIENVIGSSANDFIIGDPGVNRLEGGAGDDTIIGGLGADVLIGGPGIDLLSFEDNSGTVFINLLTGRGYNNAAEGDTFSGFENVIGGLFDDTLIGDNGANRLDGAMGADTLVGNGGADTFVFKHAPGSSSGFVHPNSNPNVDTLFDFVSGEDKLEISASAFGGGLSAGSLAAGAFVVGTAAGDADDRFVYDQANGMLYFDADGSGGGAQVLMALLPNHDAIAAIDFIIIG